MNALHPDQLVVPKSSVIPVTSHPPANKIIGLAIVFSQKQGDWTAFSQKELALAKEAISAAAFLEGWQFLLQIGLLRKVGEEHYLLSEKCINTTNQLLSM
jgi:hypothetical protein